MTPADEFLATYRKLENYMREAQDAGPTTSFSALLKSSQNRPVKRYRYQLQRYGDLRNAIVHHEHEDDHPIADPREDVIKDFRRIVDNVTQPLGITPYLTDVHTASAEDDIGHVVEKMEEGDFSQMPIRDDNRVTGVLTANTVARWVGAELHKDGQGLLVTDTLVKHVLPHSEREDNYEFLNRSANVYEAYELFQADANPRQPPDAVLITHNGKPDESLLGIITPFDLPDLASRL